MIVNGVRNIFSVLEDITIMAVFEPASGGALISGLTPTGYVYSLEDSSISGFILSESMLDGLYTSTIPNDYFVATGQFVYVVKSGDVTISEYVGSFYRGVDLAILDLVSDKNRKIAFNIATEVDLSRNVVIGAVEGMTVQIKGAGEDNFDSPIDEATTLFTYQRASITSDVVLKVPSGVV